MRTTASTLSPRLRSINSDRTHQAVGAKQGPADSHGLCRTRRGARARAPVERVGLDAADVVRLHAVQRLHELAQLALEAAADRAEAVALAHLVAAPARLPPRHTPCRTLELMLWQPCSRPRAGPPPVSSPPPPGSAKGRGSELSLCSHIAPSRRQRRSSAAAAYATSRYLGTCSAATHARAPNTCGHPQRRHVYDRSTTWRGQTNTCRHGARQSRAPARCSWPPPRAGTARPRTAARWPAAAPGARPPQSRGSWPGTRPCGTARARGAVRRRQRSPRPHTALPGTAARAGGARQACTSMPVWLQQLQRRGGATLDVPHRGDKRRA